MFLSFPDGESCCGAAAVLLCLLCFGAYWGLYRWNLSSATRRKHPLYPGQLIHLIDVFSVPVAIFRKEDLTVQYVNKAFSEHFGSGLTAGMTAAQLFDDKNAADILLALSGVAKRDTTIHIIHKLGSGLEEVYMESTIEFTGDEHLFAVLSMHEVTALQVRLELRAKELQMTLLDEALVLTGEELELAYLAAEKTVSRTMKILEQIPDEIVIKGVGYWSYDLDTLQLQLSEAARDIFKPVIGEPFTLHQLLGFIDRQYTGELERALQELLQGERSCYYQARIGSGPSEQWICTSVKLVFGKTRRPVTIRGISMTC